MSSRFSKRQWALVLGGSSGFGLASATHLAEQGMNVVVLHRDRRGAMDEVEASFDRARRTGVGFLTFNADALAVDTRERVLAALTEALGADGRVRLLLHSIAW